DVLERVGLREAARRAADDDRQFDLVIHLKLLARPANRLAGTNNGGGDFHKESRVGKKRRGGGFFNVASVGQPGAGYLVAARGGREQLDFSQAEAERLGSLRIFLCKQQRVFGPLERRVTAANQFEHRNGQRWGQTSRARGVSGVEIDQPASYFGPNTGAPFLRFECVETHDEFRPIVRRDYLRSSFRIASVSIPSASGLTLDAEGLVS